MKIEEDGNVFNLDTIEDIAYFGRFSKISFKSAGEVFILTDTLRAFTNSIEKRLSQIGLPRKWDEKEFKRIKRTGITLSDQQFLAKDGAPVYFEMEEFEDCSGKIFVEKERAAFIFALKLKNSLLKKESD